KLEGFAGGLAPNAEFMATQRNDVASPWLLEIVAGCQLLASRLGEAGREGVANRIAAAAVSAATVMAERMPSNDITEAQIIASNALSNRFARTGRAAEALKISQEAADLARALIDDEGRKRLSLLAGSLTNLGLRLRETGDV